MSEPLPLAPIVRESVPEQVARRVLDLVVARQLRPGDQLPPERDLAEALGVSRPSVREAIRGLQILGVVRSRQGGGHLVTALDADAILGPIRFFLALEPANVRALYDVRALIEAEVARLAAARLSEQDLWVMGEMLRRQEGRLGDPAYFRKSDFAFHQVVWEGCGNPFLKRIGESLHALGLEVRTRASETPGVLQQSFRDHGRLLDALQARDGAGAAEAAAEHMRNVLASSVRAEGAEGPGRGP